MSKFSDNLNDEVNTELDKRKMQELIDSGKVDAFDIANAPVYSVSECCGADMLAEPDDPVDKLPTCEKCGKPCRGAEG